MSSVFSYYEGAYKHVCFYAEDSVPELRHAIFRGEKVWGYWLDNDGYVYSTRQHDMLKKLVINYYNEYPSICLRINNKSVG